MKYPDTDVFKTLCQLEPGLQFYNDTFDFKIKFSLFLLLKLSSSKSLLVSRQGYIW